LPLLLGDGHGSETFLLSKIELVDDLRRRVVPEDGRVVGGPRRRHRRHNSTDLVSTPLGTTLVPSPSMAPVTMDVLLYHLLQACAEGAQGGVTTIKRLYCDGRGDDYSNRHIVTHCNSDFSMMSPNRLLLLWPSMATNTSYITSLLVATVTPHETVAIQDNNNDGHLVISP
jgi:hypothetical protein